jgi:hypothetical protein
MEIKRYQNWLFEKQNPTNDCGCQNHGFITESISYDEVMAKHNELDQLDQPLTEADGKFGPFIPGSGGTSPEIQLRYAAGYYSVDHTTKAKNPGDTPVTFTNSTRYKVVVDQLLAFLNSEPKKKWVQYVVLKAGESIIPNYDTEGGGGILKTGDLANKRKDKIQAEINKIFQPLLGDVITKLPETKLVFQQAKTLTEPSGGWEDYKKWNREKDPAKKSAMPNNAEYTNLKKGYDADQMVTISFRAAEDLGSAQCMSGLKILVNYDDTKIGHTCDYARFEITVNGVPLKTSNGGFAEDGWLPAGLPYASMNNNNAQYDDLKQKWRGAEKGGIRKNAFKLDTVNIIKQIAAAGDGKTLVIKSKCIKLGNGYSSESACHSSAPHVYVYQGDGKLAKGFPTYPQGNMNDGILATTDLCGNNQGVQNLTTKAEGSTAAPAGPKLTGVKLGFAALKVGTLTSEQNIQNFVSSGVVTKQKDNTYLVNKPFEMGDIKYLAGDIINKILPKGTVIPQPTRPAPAK